MNQSHKGFSQSVHKLLSKESISREARDLIFKIRSYSARSDLKNKQKTTENTLFLRSDLAL